jgi:hypothetical protein
MTRYLIKYVQDGEELRINISCHDEQMAEMFFEWALPQATIMSIEKSVVQIVTPKPCLN